MKPGTLHWDKRTVFRDCFFKSSKRSPSKAARYKTESSFLKDFYLKRSKHCGTLLKKGRLGMCYSQSLCSCYGPLQPGYFRSLQQNLVSYRYCWFVKHTQCLHKDSEENPERIGNGYQGHILSETRRGYTWNFGVELKPLRVPKIPEHGCLPRKASDTK